MTPETHGSDGLLIVEDLALLLADDASGTPAGAATLHYSLGGALLVELALLGRVETEKGSWLTGALVHATGDEPLPDPLLQEAFDVIAVKPRAVSSVILTLGDGLWDRLVGRLVDRGLLERQKSKLLGIFPTTKYPATDDPYEPALRARVAAVLEDGEPADPRTAGLVALVSASGTLPLLHPRPKWSSAVHDRGKEFEKGNWGAQATATAVAQATAAATAASVAASIAATTNTTT